jgi:deazaflavin-dependent oxidoreductase (nitroreductase family)
MTDTRAAPTTKPSQPGHSSPNRAPWLVRAPNGLVRWLMRVGMPMGPNVLMTVRGRTSGLPRTAPVAVSEIDGRRYVIGAYGDVHWVRNLRAAGEASLRLRGRDVHVTAIELDPVSARAFFADTVPGYIASFPWFGRSFLRILFRLVAGDILTDPDRAAATRPVFELQLNQSRQS